MAGRMGSIGLWSGELWRIICTLISKCFLMSVGGLFNLEPLYTYARARGAVGSALCLILRELCWGQSPTQQSFIKWPWSQHKHVWCKRLCVIFFSLIPGLAFSCFQLNVGLRENGRCILDWTPVATFTPCLLITDWNQLLYLNLQQQSVWSCLNLLEKWYFFFSIFPPCQISKGIPNSPMAYLHGKGWTDLWKL